jgi:glyoxylase-like metal-dependent hydrolase (beta-lactamase superfamily II)
MLIDFGTTQKPPKPRKSLMMDIAKDIVATVGGHLHVIVATHRHTDHIGGFATNAKKNGNG